MATFPCTYFRYSTKYPESGSRMQLGNSYMYSTPPASPDQRIFRLTLPGMQYFLDAQGALDATVNVERNMKVLEDFYTVHRLAFSFDFNHPVYGALVCQFSRPLQVPEGVAGGGGVLEDVTVELLEIP